MHKRYHLAILETVAFLLSYSNMPEYSQTRQQFPLSSRKIIKKTILMSIGWVFFFGFILTGIVVALLASGSDSSLGLLALFGTIMLLAIIVGLVYLYERWYFETYFYELTQDYIVIKKNPITPREITIPYVRIQDVYVDQDIWDRIFGIYDVHLSSATISSGMEAHIDGLEKPAADGIRAVLLQIIGERISKQNHPSHHG